MLILCYILTIIFTISILRHEGKLYSPTNLFYWIILLNYLILQFYTVLPSNNSGLSFLPTEFAFSAMPLNFDSTALSAANIQYFLLLSYGYLLTIFFSKKQEKQEKQYDIHLNFGTMTERQQLLLTISLIITLMLLTLHFFSMDSNILWQNHTYLLMADPMKMGIKNVLLRSVHLFIPFFGLISAGLIIHFYYSRSHIYLFLTTPIFLYSLVLMLAQNSRWAPLYFFIMFLYCVLLKKGNLLIYCFFIGVGFLFFLKVLIGRGGYNQGISSIFYGFSEIKIGSLFFYFMGFLNNIGEGAIGFANAELIAPTYDLKYKILSFSPFPSLIDGFSSIKPYNEIRISKHVPMSSISEARWFGVFFILIFHSTLIFLLKTANKVFYSTKGIVPVIITGFVCWAVFTMSSYPIRNIYRIILLMIFCLIFIDRNKEIFIKNTNGDNK